jgi:hypothetical protein
MKKALLVVLFLSFFCIPGKLYALDAVELMTGYFGLGFKDLEESRSTYEGVPLYVSFDFDIKPALAKIGLHPKGRVDFSLEPYAHTILKPDPNLETGTDFLVKYVFPLSDKFQPYIKGGEGLSYMTAHTKEQSTQFNFVSQVAAGFHYFVKQDLALNLEYRFRHLSNAGIDHPNNGINSDFVLGGLTYFFNDKKSNNN